MFSHIERNADGARYVVLRAVGDAYEYDRLMRREGDLFDAAVHDAEALVLAGRAKEFVPPARTVPRETTEMIPAAPVSPPPKRRRSYKRKGQ